MADLYYAYGVFEGIRDVPEGIGIMVEHENQLTMAFELVSELEFGEDHISGNLQDMEWVTKKATRHQRILEAINQSGGVIPFSFGTIFKTRSALLDSLRSREAYFLQTLSFLGNRKEWGIKLYYSQSLLQKWIQNNDPVIVQRLAQLEEATPGKKFILKKQLEGEVKTRCKDRVNEARKALHDALMSLKCELRMNENVSSDLSGRKETNVLNTAILLEEERWAELNELALSQNQKWGYGDSVFVEVTGPWPAYNFVKNE